MLAKILSVALESPPVFVNTGRGVLVQTVVIRSLARAITLKTEALGNE